MAASAVNQVMAGRAGLSPMALVRGTAGLNPLHGPAIHSDAEIKQVAKNFESIFLEMMMKEMRNSVQKSGLMGNSRGMEFFEGMYDEQLSRQLSTGGGIGLGQMVYEKLKAATVPHQKTFS
jgi:flagellar protein FlgJ